jgi:hypothetical protein
MSSTGRKNDGGEKTDRQEKDNYPTPLWAIRSIIAAIWHGASDPANRPAGRPLSVLDPCVGEGGFLLELAKLTTRWPEARRPVLQGVEIRDDAAREAHLALARLDASARIVLGDFLSSSTDVGDCFDLVLTNPPYGEEGTDLATKFVQRSLDRVRVGGQVVMLLRLNWVCDGEERYQRASWLADGNVPDVFALTRRPSFVGGGTDSCGYGALRWIKGRYRTEGSFRVIPCRAPGVLPVLEGHGFSIAHDRPDDWRKKPKRKTSDDA